MLHAMVVGYLVVEEELWKHEEKSKRIDT